MIYLRICEKCGNCTDFKDCPYCKEKEKEEEWKKKNSNN